MANDTKVAKGKFVVQPTNIEMVLIEKSALMLLTSVGKSVLIIKAEQDQPDSTQTMAIETAVYLAEKAMEVSKAARS